MLKQCILYIYSLASIIIGMKWPITSGNNLWHVCTCRAGEELNKFHSHTFTYILPIPVFLSSLTAHFPRFSSFIFNHNTHFYLILYVRLDPFLYFHLCLYIMYTHNKCDSSYHYNQRFSKEIPLDGWIYTYVDIQWLKFNSCIYVYIYIHGLYPRVKTGLAISSHIHVYIIYLMYILLVGTSAFTHGSFFFFPSLFDADFFLIQVNTYK